MKWLPHWRPVLAVLFASSPLCGVAANESDETDKNAARYSAELALGGEYDSNVAVEEVDATSGESDYALILDAELGVKKPLSEDTEASLNYNFSQSWYDEFSRVNRQTHILGANIDSDFGRLTTGLSGYYINSQLDGEGFLDMYRVSPSLSGFLGKKWFARGAYVYSDKAIDDRPDRDATTNTGEVDVYFFRRGLRSYFNAGYRFKDEDANADRYDYRSHGLKLRYIHRIDLWQKVAKLELAWRFEDRDYGAETPSIGEDREDRRHRWKVDFELPLFSSSAVQLYAGYGDYDSNLPQADYSQEIVGTRFIKRW